MKGNRYKTNRSNFTCVEQGGAPLCDGRSVSTGGACYDLEDVMAVGVQIIQSEVSHAGIADDLHRKRAVSTLHLCR